MRRIFKSVVIAALFAYGLVGCGPARIDNRHSRHVHYAYDGWESLIPVRRKVDIQAVVEIRDAMLYLDVQNEGNEKFLLDGEDIFLMDSRQSVLRTMAGYWIQDVVYPGESRAISFGSLKDYQELDVRRIDVKKRNGANIETMFSMQVPYSF